jgi:hypothetical protein
MRVDKLPEIAGRTLRGTLRRWMRYSPKSRILLVADYLGMYHEDVQAWVDDQMSDRLYAKFCTAEADVIGDVVDAQHESARQERRSLFTDTTQSRARAVKQIGVHRYANEVWERRKSEYASTFADAWAKSNGVTLIE